MDKKTARSYAEECRRVAEQYASTDTAKANWLRMADAFEADAAGDADDEHPTRTSKEHDSTGKGVQDN
jgi:hypothetical protein